MPSLATIILSIILLIILIKIIRYLLAGNGSCSSCSSASVCHGSCATNTKPTFVEEYHKNK